MYRYLLGVLETFRCTEKHEPGQIRGDLAFNSVYGDEAWLIIHCIYTGILLASAEGFGL